MAERFSPAIVTDLEAAMDALSVQQGGDTVSHTKLSDMFTASGRQASLDIAKHALAIVDDFGSDALAVDEVPDTIFHALGNIFVELGRTAREQHEQAATIARLNGNDNDADADADRTAEWIQSMATAKYQKKAVDAEVDRLMDELDAQDDAVNLTQHCRITGALDAAVKLARIMFEREIFKRHLAVEVLSSQRETLNTMTRLELGETARDGQPARVRSL